MKNNEIKNETKYVVSDSVRDSIINGMESVLKERRYLSKREALEKIFDTEIEHKQPLLQMLSKSPNWNNEKLMIQFNADYSREFNRGAIYEFVDFLIDIVDYYNRSRKERGECERVFDFMRYAIRDQFFNSDMKESINDLNEMFPDFKLRTNMKSSKAIGKICKEMGWDKLGGTYIDNRGVERSVFNREYAKLCDNLNPIKVTRHTCISLNPIDFLLMSNGNSWTSCHDIRAWNDDPGCYSSGTVSYMLDRNSFVFYTVDANYDGNEIEKEPKMQRQIFAYKDGVLFQSRLYPQSMDCGAEQVYKDIREIVQKVIAECIEFPNLWTTNHKWVHSLIETDENATLYPDWEENAPGHPLCRVSVLNNYFEDESEDTLSTNGKLVIGYEPYCIECGCAYDGHRLITCCENHSKDYVCASCGDYISEEEVFWYNGQPYCKHCVRYCDICGTYVPYDEVSYVEDYGNVCDSCLEEKFITCDECGDYVEKEFSINIDGRNLCPDCYLSEFSERWKNVYEYDLKQDKDIIDRLKAVTERISYHYRYVRKHYFMYPQTDMGKKEMLCVIAEPYAREDTKYTVFKVCFLSESTTSVSCQKRDVSMLECSGILERELRNIKKAFKK